MYVLVYLLIKGLVPPWKFIDAPVGEAPAS